jgi:phosphoribosylglycinamide formyltransferase 1
VSPRLVVLVSGSGTLLEAMVAAGTPVALVASDRPCRGLDVASAAAIPTVLVDRRDFGGFSSAFDRDAYAHALVAALGPADLIAMAGFGTILSRPFHEAFPGRVLNTHPSLLPAFKGWHAVRDALAAGVPQTGCTVHVATEALDDGPVLAQATVDIVPGDDEVAVHERIKAVERVLYPRVIRAVLEDLVAGRLPGAESAGGATVTPG